MSENNDVVQDEVLAVDAVEAGTPEATGDDWKTVAVETAEGHNWFGAKSYRGNTFGRMTYREIDTLEDMPRRSRVGGEYVIDAILFALPAYKDGVKPRLLDAVFVAIHVEGGGWRKSRTDEMLSSAINYVGEMGYPTLDNQHNVYIGSARPGGPTILRPAVMGPAAA